MYQEQKNCFDWFLLLTVNISFQGLISTLNSIVSLQDHPWCLTSFLRMHSSRFLSYSRKRKISQNDHSLSLVIVRCYSLSLVVPPVVTRCTTRCHSLSLVVIRCYSLYHSLSLVVTRCITRLSFYKQSFCRDKYLFEQNLLCWII